MSKRSNIIILCLLITIVTVLTIMRIKINKEKQKLNEINKKVTELMEHSAWIENEKKFKRELSMAVDLGESIQVEVKQKHASANLTIAINNVLKGKEAEELAIKNGVKAKDLSTNGIIIDNENGKVDLSYSDDDQELIAIEITYKYKNIKVSKGSTLTQIKPTFHINNGTLYYTEKIGILENQTNGLLPIENVDIKDTNNVEITGWYLVPAITSLKHYIGIRYDDAGSKVYMKLFK